MIAFRDWSVGIVEDCSNIMVYFGICGILNPFTTNLKKINK